MLNAFKSALKSKASLAFVFGFTLYILIMLPDLIQSGGIIYSSGDYNTISMPFIYHVRDSILEGKELIWDRSSGLGGQFLSQYAYYNLFSPFTLLYLVIPRNILAYAIPYVYAVKFGVGTMLGYFYIRRYVSNPHYAVIGGIVYAFHILYHVITIVKLMYAKIWIFDLWMLDTCLVLLPLKFG